MKVRRCGRIIFEPDPAPDPDPELRVQYGEKDPRRLNNHRRWTGLFVVEPSGTGPGSGWGSNKTDTEDSILIQVVLLKHAEEHRLAVIRLDRRVLFDLRLEAGDDPGVDLLQHLFRLRDAALAPEVLSRGGRFLAKTRYRQELAACTLVALDGGHLEVRFDRPQHSVTPGQHLVLYTGSGRIIAGGEITRPT